jgi:hypothetical protein
MAAPAAVPAAARSYRTAAPLVTVRKPIMATMIAPTAHALIHRNNARSSWRVEKPVFVMTVPPSLCVKRCGNHSVRLGDEL